MWWLAVPAVAAIGAWAFTRHKEHAHAPSAGPAPLPGQPPVVLTGVMPPGANVGPAGYPFPSIPGVPPGFLPPLPGMPPQAPVTPAAAPGTPVAPAPIAPAPVPTARKKPRYSMTRG